MSFKIPCQRNSWFSNGDLFFPTEESKASGSQPAFDETIPGMVVDFGISRKPVECDTFSVLCFDDDPINTKISEIALKSLGIPSFFPVHSMNEFIKLFDPKKEIPLVDVFFLDYNLHPADTHAGFTGYEVAQRIRQIWGERNLEQPFLVSFSSEFETFSSAMMYSGKNFSGVFDEILRKPMPPSQIKQFLEKYYEFSPPLKNQPDPFSRQLVTERSQNRNRYEVAVSSELSELLSLSSQPPSPLSLPQSLPLGQESPHVSSPGAGVVVNENGSPSTSSIRHSRYCSSVCCAQ